MTDCTCPRIDGYRIRSGSCPTIAHHPQPTSTPDWSQNEQWEAVGTRLTAFSCARCGALVLAEHTKTHLDWHRSGGDDD